MNRKGEGEVSMILVVAISLIAGLVIYGAIVSEVGKMTTTSMIYNQTYTAPATGVVIDLDGVELIGTPIVYNESTGDVVPTSNYTIDEGISATTSQKTIRYTSLGGLYDSVGINVTYERGNDGYIAGSGARSMVALIAVFAALALAVVALTPVFRSGVMDLMKN